MPDPLVTSIAVSCGVAVLGILVRCIQKRLEATCEGCKFSCVSSQQGCKCNCLTGESKQPPKEVKEKDDVREQLDHLVRDMVLRAVLRSRSATSSPVHRSNRRIIKSTSRNDLGGVVVDEDKSAGVVL